jgi:ElaB/YqjD/DUF883 family membrane-anchored ribosome-binding protein
MADQEEMTPEEQKIREQMEQTRSSLSEKLETLEQQVVQTVQGATCAVSETVENVKEAVQDTVQTVKGTVENTVESVRSTFDFSRHVDEHPWACMGGAAAAGFITSYVFGGSDKSRPAPARSRRESWTGPADERRPAEERRTSAASDSGFQRLFGDEIGKLRGIALGTLFGVVRDLVSEMVPRQIEPQVTDLINRVTSKLGGEPVEGHLIHSGNGRHGSPDMGHDMTKGSEGTAGSARPR